MKVETDDGIVDVDLSLQPDLVPSPPAEPMKLTDEEMAALQARMQEQQQAEVDDGLAEIAEILKSRSLAIVPMFNVVGTSPVTLEAGWQLRKQV